MAEDLAMAAAHKVVQQLRKIPLISFDHVLLNGICSAAAHSQPAEWRSV
jgi:hypothetical protein